VAKENIKITERGKINTEAGDNASEKTSIHILLFMTGY